MLLYCFNKKYILKNLKLFNEIKLFLDIYKKQKDNE